MSIDVQGIIFQNLQENVNATRFKKFARGLMTVARTTLICLACEHSYVGAQARIEAQARAA